MKQHNERDIKKRKELIEIAAEIIKTEGLEHATARKIAAKAGYVSSSTIYNYFEEISHLTLFAAMRFIDDYYTDLIDYFNKGKNYLEKYIYTWDCLCQHSFKKPNIYSTIFIADLGVPLHELHKQYFNIFTSLAPNLPNELQMLSEQYDFKERNKYLLEIAAKENTIDRSQINTVNDVVIHYWIGMLTSHLNNRSNLTNKQAANKTITNIQHIIQLYIEANKPSKG